MRLRRPLRLNRGESATRSPHNQARWQNHLPDESVRVFKPFQQELGCGSPKFFGRLRHSGKRRTKEIAQGMSSKHTTANSSGMRTPRSMDSLKRPQSHQVVGDRYGPGPLRHVQNPGHCGIAARLTEIAVDNERFPQGNPGTPEGVLIPAQALLGYADSFGPFRRAMSL